MKSSEIDKALRKKFVSEDQRLVFWHDEEGEFSDHFDEGIADDLGGARLLKVADIGGFAIKLQLEVDDTTGKYLIYSHGERGAVLEEDWLIDIRLYSTEFRADIASLWQQDLGLRRLTLRDHLKKRDVFLRSQDRCEKLKAFIDPNDDQAAIDLKMMAVLVKAPFATLSDVLRALIDGHYNEGVFDLANEPKILTPFKKMGLFDGFWGRITLEFGYFSETPTIAVLLRRLFVSEFLSQAPNIPSLRHFLLAKNQRNVKLFLTKWRDSNKAARSYDAASDAVADEQNIRSYLGDIAVEDLRGVFTFWIEKKILSKLKTQLIENKTIDAEDIRAIATERKNGHWLSGPGKDDPERQAAREAYDAIVAAADLITLHATHRNALSFDSPEDALVAYRDTLYLYDRLYREFWTRAEAAMGQGWNLLKTLGEKIEDLYTTGFIQPFGMEWSRHLDEGFLDTWSTKEFKAQQNFYKERILPEAGRKRVFVIISDALRYEAAVELTKTLNGRNRVEAELSSMLSVLPSCTTLGMASLLPHQSLTYNDKGLAMTDGKSTAGIEGRNKQLASVEGLACKATELRKMKSDEAREYVKGKQVVYIYHDIIDARGDVARTEGETFSAVRDCIVELLDLIKFCVDRFNAAKIWVTADHGFLYQQAPLSASMKTDLSLEPDVPDVPADAVKKNKRYVIGRKLGISTEAHNASTANTAGTEDAMEIWLPRGPNRFVFKGGGNRFVHGGAMPQEVVIPVVTITQLRGEKAKLFKVDSVPFQLLGSNHKITTPTHRFEFIQTEAVSERRKAITVRAGIYDEGNELVTSVENITFDSASENMNERKKTIRLELRSGTFAKTTSYTLVLRDLETDAQIQAIPIIIDRSFDDDFQ